MIDSDQQRHIARDDLRQHTHGGADLPSSALDEGREIYEAGDEAGDQRGDERLAAAPADDEIGFLESIRRRRCASGVALKDDEVIRRSFLDRRWLSAPPASMTKSPAS
jgi:hypothetical protein